MLWAAIKKAINSDLNVPLNEGGVKIVKSVQRGNYEGDYVADWGSANPDSSNRTIKINEVDLNKAILIVNGGDANMPQDTGGIHLADSTTISIPYKTHSYENHDYDTYLRYSWTKFSWQVIEFY